MLIFNLKVNDEKLYIYLKIILSFIFTLQLICLNN
jgi:hypothetical protein